MPDRQKVIREKVIKGLECCSQMSGEACNECPYANECEEGEGLLAGAAHLAANALDLLKGQDPRVLTWDEMMALPHGKEDNACVVLEEKVPVNRWDLGSIWKWTGAAFVQERAEDHRIYNRDSYGKVWRCWNTKPTKEQREGTKWND